MEKIENNIQQMKYQVIFYKNEIDNILYETNDFELAKCYCKSIANKYKLVPHTICPDSSYKDVICLYYEMKGCKIIKAVGIKQIIFTKTNA